LGSVAAGWGLEEAFRGCFAVVAVFPGVVVYGLVCFPSPPDRASYDMVSAFQLPAPALRLGLAS
jgi:hypothetical protein